MLFYIRKKNGGLPVYPSYEDFVFCLNSSELFDTKFKGKPFTWWNWRAADDCIFKRLDRILINQEWLGLFINVEVEHLVRKRSNHGLLVVLCGGQAAHNIKPFKFMKF